MGLTEWFDKTIKKPFKDWSALESAKSDLSRAVSQDVEKLNVVLETIRQMNGLDEIKNNKLTWLSMAFKEGNGKVFAALADTLDGPGDDYKDSNGYKWSFLGQAIVSDKKDIALYLAKHPDTNVLRPHGNTGMIQAAREKGWISVVIVLARRLAAIKYREAEALETEACRLESLGIDMDGQYKNLPNPESYLPTPSRRNESRGAVNTPG